MLKKDLGKLTSKSVSNKIIRGDISNSRLKSTDMGNQFRKSFSYKEGGLGHLLPLTNTNGSFGELVNNNIIDKYAFKIDQ